jgi:hypothetical protein
MPAKLLPIPTTKIAFSVEHLAKFTATDFAAGQDWLSALSFFQDILSLIGYWQEY